ncbi:MAG: GAF domain-containing protein [Proteobacteria bacterium]|nr:GAF domain-containing protein [Pseudomonadota bacterium]
MAKGIEKNWFNEISLKNKNLHYKLYLIVGLFFVFPVFGILFYAIKHDFLNDESLRIFLVAFLVFSLLGIIMLRRIFQAVANISKKISERIVEEISDFQPENGIDELTNIIQSFNAIEHQFKVTFEQLEKNASKISTLKELSDLCYITYDTEELMYITLERALKLVNADLGSVLMLERPDRKKFIVQATIGLGDLVKVGDRIDFEKSISKYAVINKSPLLVNDIEKDSRFGRNNRPLYGTKSFICMPLKTINDIIGVITVSRRNDDMLFMPEDVEVLTSLLSGAAFTYENLRLLKENEQNDGFLRQLEKIFNVINSSFKDSELIYAILNEIQALVPFEAAIIMMKEETKPHDLVVFDFFSHRPINLSRGSYYNYKDTVFDKVMKQGATINVNDTETMTNEIEKELFLGQGYKSCLLSALKIQGNVEGVLVLCTSRPEAFQKTTEFIGLAKDSLSLAIERNKLSVVVVKRDQELDTLKEIGNTLAISTFDIDKVLNYAMDMIRVVMDVGAGSLFLLHDSELEFKITFGNNIEELTKFKLKLGQGISGYVASQGKPLIVNDVTLSPHFFSDIDKFTGFETRSVLCVPMISQGKVLGVIELINKINGDFGPGDEHLLQSIVSSLVIAMENARLYQETISMTEHERGIRQMFQKFVPMEVVDKIVYGKDTEKAIIDEFRSLTLLNIDIRGFSKLAKEMGPQKTVSMLNYFFSIMGSTVFNHHGIVDKYLGDGFLAIFGAPVSSTMDADNAIAAALEMKKSIETVSDHFLQELGAPLVIGISIHTGEVVIGNIGFDKKMDYTVIGDSVNTAFRLQNLVKTLPNGILISEDTRRAAQSHLDINELGEYEIDSTIGTLKVYELLGQEKY